MMVILCAIILAVFRPKRPVLYKIAEGYKGWTIVKYDDPSCPPLEHENIFLVVNVSSGGIGCTSSPPNDGWRITLYEYVRDGKRTSQIPQSGWGGKGEIWAGSYIPSKHSESFFVGAQELLEKSWSQRPR